MHVPTHMTPYRARVMLCGTEDAALRVGWGAAKIMRFHDILVYAEVDDAASLAGIVQLARHQGAAVTVCDVVAASPEVSDSRGVMEKVSRLRWSSAFRRLRRLCEPFDDAMVIDYTVFTGIPFLAIIEQVIRQHFDLVVHISDPVVAESGTGLNATGMHLMRKCPCAIWALHPSRDSGGSQDVLLALDREAHVRDSGSDGFAMRLANAALAVARARGGDLHVLHAWETFGAEVLKEPELGLREAEVAAYRAEQRASSEQWFRGMFQRIESEGRADVKVHPHLIEGAVLPAVRRVVGESGADLITLGSIGTSAVPGVLIGTTAESILAAVGTSVLALKPPSFESPLRFP